MRFRIGSTLVVICVLVTAASSQRGLSPNEVKLFNLVNLERAKVGLPAFQWNYVLAEVARGHGVLMAKHKELSHQFPEEELLGDRIGAMGLRFSSVSENVASASTVENAHQRLMASSQDKANLLSDRYNSLGLAIVPVGNELYLVQEFAYVLPLYSEGQFSDAVVSAFNKARQAKGIGAIDVRSDPRL